MFCQDKMLEIFQAGSGRGRGRGEQHRHARGTNAIRSGEEGSWKQIKLLHNEYKNELHFSFSFSFYFCSLHSKNNSTSSEKEREEDWEREVESNEKRANNAARRRALMLHKQWGIDWSEIRVESSRGSSIINSSLSCTYAACFYSNCQLADKLFDCPPCCSFSPPPPLYAFPRCYTMQQTVKCNVAYV